MGEADIGIGNELLAPRRMDFNFAVGCVGDVKIHPIAEMIAPQPDAQPLQVFGQAQMRISEVNNAR
ncbi:hypothetical protein RAD15_41530 [Bradyrhizobium sp. 14AA]